MTFDYPAADRDATVDVLHGVTIADPYRYLEYPDSERTRAFVRVQNDLSRPYLDALPGAAPFLALTAALVTAPRRGVPGSAADGISSSRTRGSSIRTGC